MKQFKALIIDDEHFAQEGLKKLIQHRFSDNFHQIDAVESVKKGVEYILQESPDLIFLDIHMPDQYGFKLFDYFDQLKAEVIFTTAHSDYLLEAVNQWGCSGYLMKPIMLKDLDLVIGRFIKKTEQNNLGKELEAEVECETEDQFFKGLKTSLKKDKNIVFLPTLNEIIILNINDIIYCQADDSYCNVYTCEKTYTFSKSLKEIEKIIDSEHFFRVNRSYLVNISYAKKYDKRNNVLILSCSSVSEPIIVPVTQLGAKLMMNVSS